MDVESNRYVPGIDAVRCFAMTAVIVLHVGLLPFGWAGVWLFFVISGFAITRSLCNDLRSDRPGSSIILHFYWKRTLRIMPLYLFYLLVVAVYAAALELGSFWSALPYLASLTYNVAIAFGSPAISAPGVVQLWSLSGEEQFYIAFPFLFVFLRRRAFVATLFALIALSPIARELVSVAMSGPMTTPAQTAQAVFFFTPVHFDAFAAGALIALATDRRAVSVRTGSLALGAGLGILVLYCAWYVALQAHRVGFATASLHNVLSGRVVGEGREAVVYTAVWAASAGLLLAVIARVPLVEIICRPRIFRSIGRVSYGGYVYHGLFIELLTRFVPGINTGSILHKLGYFALLYALTLAAAFGSFRWIESPFLKFKPGGPGWSGDHAGSATGGELSLGMSR